MLLKDLRRRVTPLSENEDLMFLGLSRGCPPSPRLPSSVLFPEISHVDCRFDIRGCEGWKARSPSGLSCVNPFSVALRVPSDHEFVEGLADPPSKVSPTLPRDKLLTPRVRGRPKKVENRGRKRKTPTESSNGMTIADGIAVDSGSRGKELMVLPKEFSEPYGVLTRARSKLLMGKRCGMKYDCTDDTALY
ncbi:uncharacterized protein LOC130738713 [Lotus japonicus]|uniref:uncharacterized protein LOC130738713 n=1 Tax=Lotus japonicus TaxID=34305 RepID=UPI002583739C|nr:uncharacterized protein LOC130738713 [Lotus japonicus]